MIYRPVAVLAVICFGILWPFEYEPASADKLIDQKTAIQIANNEARSLGYAVDTMEVAVAQFNTPWNDWIPREATDEHMVERREKLTGKVYFAVSYTSKKKQLGGNIVVFIDHQSGMIITTYLGK